MWNTNAGKKKPHVIIYFGYRPYRGAWIMRGGFLINGNSRRKSFDGIHVRFVHLSQKLPGIGRERFYIPPLTFRKDRIKSQRRFAGTGKPGDHHQFIPRDIDGYIF